LDGDCASRALAINSRGQVVGNSFSCTDPNGPFHLAFLWESGSIIDLNALIPAGSPLQLVATNDINARGGIAGEGVPPGVDPNFSTQGHAFLLIPCDENHPDVEGCNYSPVEANTAVPQTSPEVRNPSSRTLPQFHDGARFDNADLEGADLLYTNVKRARFDGAMIGPTSTIPGAYAGARREW
jgi:probable HAF family extracellular repeat protein